MLRPEYLLKVGDEIETLFFELETEILKDIAERIKDNKYSMTTTAQYQIKKLEQLGLQTEYINSMIAKYLNISEDMAYRIMNNSIYETMRSDMEIYKEAGLLDGKKFDLTEEVKLGTNALNGELKNLCRSTVQFANSRFMELLDKAYLSVSSGLMSPQQAIENCVKELSSNGLQMVEYSSGAHRQLDSAVRTAVRTAVVSNACASQMKVIDELDVNLVETSSHMGARPSHAKWQGKIFWTKHKYKNYKNFYDATRYGHGDGLGGWNCRHSFYPYIEGVSEKTYEHFNESENKEQYELEQQQRYNERKIREWKRRQQIMDSAGLDSTKERMKVREWQKINKDFVDKYSDKLKREYGREKAYLSSTNKKTYMTVSRQTEPKEKQRVLRESYEKAKENGEISSLVPFKEYNQVAYNLTNKIVGTETKDGIMITGFVPHMIDRVIGNYKASNEPINEDSFSVKNNLYGTRKGVSVKDVLDCLLNGSSSGIQIDKQGRKSIVYKSSKCKVTVNPDTGELIQTNKISKKKVK